MNVLNKILKPLNIQLNRSQSLGIEKSNYEKTVKRLSEFYIDFYKKNCLNVNQDVFGIAFSKDRAMQLHALLSSYFHFTKNYAPLIILFTYSNPQHKEAYEILQQELKAYPVTFIKETGFADQLKEIVKNISADRLFFMTDDAVFLDHYDLADCLKFNPFDTVFSLRLGGDFDFCYSYNKKQAVPEFLVEDIKGGKYYSWLWADMTDSPDWIYPLSVDATIFLKKEIEAILDHISFKSPNSLESQMQLYSPLFIRRKGVCFPKTKYVNVPCNIVQNEFDNISTGAFSVNELTDRFLQGERIDWKVLQNHKVRDVQTVTFSFIKDLSS